MKVAVANSTGGRVPIKDGLLSGPLSQLDRVRLAGCRCASCGETAFGRKVVCPNCGAAAVNEIALSDRGKLWSFTVIRHRPPGNYKGPDPFAPFGLGLVELPDGIRVLSPLECEIGKLKIGLELQFKPYIRHEEDGREVIDFTFKPVNEGKDNA